MTLYYEDEHVTLYHGSCLDIPQWLEADVLITDPPYGMAYVPKNHDVIVGDEDAGIRDEILAMWEGPALVFGTWRVERPKDTRQLIVWAKGNTPGMGDLSMPWGPSHEEIYVLGEGWEGTRRSNVYNIPTIHGTAHDRPNHPTPKPIGLMEQLLAYAPQGVIADPFAGSGTTLVAASNLGRKAIGCELEEKYCEIIVQRLAAKTLF